MPRRFADLTSLALARAIADAVIRAYETANYRRASDDTRDAPTQAVLRTLERRRHGFMRFAVDAHGIAIGETEQPLTNNKQGER